MWLQYAIKSIRKNKIETEQDLIRVRREIEIMATLNHPNITMVHEGELFLLLLHHPLTKSICIGNMKVSKSVNC